MTNRRDLNEHFPSRRDIFAGLAATAALSACGNQPAAPFEIIDFHAHFVPPSIELVRPRGPNVPQEILQVFDAFSDAALLNASFQEQGVTRRIINTPLEAIVRPADEKPESRMARINEAMAETVQRSDGRLLGLATIDAYAGDVAADELSRAVSDLGLVGAFVESASGNEILSAPRARPALEAAAKLNVPVFVHPVQETAQTRQFNLKGFYQTNLGRGAMNSIALAGLLEAGVFDELPTLRTCFSSFAVTAILFGGLFNMTRPDAADLLRQHVYVDTVGVHPTMMRAMIDVLGVDRLVVGTDWPVFRGYSVRDRLIEACYELELSAPYRNMIASENAKRLLGMDAFAPLG